MAGSYPFKVLMTADTLGGVWTYALELIKALHAYHVEVSLATMGAPLNEVQRKEIKGLQNVRLFESDYKLEWMEDPWDDVEKAGKWLLKIKKEVNPDLIHLNNYAQGNLSWGKPVLIVTHSCVLSWWKSVKGGKAPASWDIYQKRIFEGLQAADVVIAPSQSMLVDAKKFYGPFQFEKVIYNGRDPFMLHSREKEPFIFSMGRIWDEAKNISLLTKIATEVPWPIYIAGDNKHPANGQLVKLPNVIFLGQLSQEKVTEWLSKAAIYVLPAKYEPFGLSILEAAMSGCALVCGDTKSLREIWGDAAIYVPQNKPKHLLKVLQNLIDNNFFRKVVSSESYNRALRFTSEKMGNEYFNVYLKLLMRQAKVFNRLIIPIYKKIRI